MSVNSRPEESINWTPSISEIAELLESLGISPPRSFDENFLSSPSISLRNLSEGVDHEESKIFVVFSKSDAPIDDHSDRKIIIEKLRIAREEGKDIEWRNNYFHEYLVEHFKRKQMMHVCTNESEDDSLLNEYLTKLDELEKSNEELRGSCEDWDAELTRTRADIKRKKEDARNAVDELIAEERAVGGSAWYCGKPLNMKRVQALISRQLDRIKDIAKFRMHYTRLRNEYISIEGELKHWVLSSPNLTKEDYERLGAEQFRYKRELTIVNQRCDEFAKRRDKLVTLVKLIRRKMIELNGARNYFERVSINLKNSRKMQFRRKKICLARLSDARDFVSRYNEIIERTNGPEFAKTMANIRREHEAWMKKISSLLKKIDNLGRSIDSFRANFFILRENNEKDRAIEKNDDISE